MRSASNDPLASRPGPLSDLMVLDFGQALSGPFCAMLLGDLGAKVIKVEAPDGDMMRHTGPFAGNESLYFTALNRNKRSLVVNLKASGSSSIVAPLIAAADVIVENFRPGVARRLGISYEMVEGLNSAIIYLSITGYGAAGPTSMWGGYDQIAQGVSGLMSVTGVSEPTRVGVPIGDVLAGVYGTVGVLAALHRRSLTGRGEHIETSLLAGLVSSLGVLAERYLSSGEVSGLAGNDHPVLYPYGAFDASDGVMNVAVGHDRQWLSLCSVLGRPDLGRASELATNELRVQHRNELKRLLNAEFRKRDRAAWTAVLNSAGVPAGPIRTLDEVFSDPQVLAQNLVEELSDGSGLVRRTLGSALQFSAGSQPVRCGAPSLGEHTDDVLLSVGFTRDAINEFRLSGVVGGSVGEAKSSGGSVT